jgi:predicted P-loop ATPase
MNEKILISKAKTIGGMLQKPVTTDLQAVVDKLRSGDNEQRVMQIAKKAMSATLDSHKREGTLIGVDALPYLLFSAVFGKGGVEDVKSFTGLVLLSVPCPGGIGEINALKARVAQLPYTQMAFAGSSGKTLKVVVACEYGDGYQPKNVADYEAMLRVGHDTAAKLYEALAGCKVAPSEAKLTSGCRMSHDADAFYRPQIQKITLVRQEEAQDASVKLTPSGEIERDEAEQLKQMQLEFYACSKKAAQESSDPESRVLALANYCRMAHLPEEFCLHRVLMNWASIPLDDDVKRKIFRAVYQKPYDGKPVSQMNEKERIARFIKDFFERRYEIRYNEVKQVEEFRERDGQGYPWRPLTSRDLKRIAFEEMLEGGPSWTMDIQTYVESSLIKPYNPIKEFLYATVPYYDADHDYIDDLARRVPTDYADFVRFFHRWFLAMVAQWLGKNRDFGNAVVPMLIGRQGTHKTTFCKKLLPESLREYYMDDIKMDNAEQVERVLGRMMLVNIDEYNAKTDREQAKIKRLLTEKDVQVRKMRSDQYTMTSRLTSFIATTNDPQPLPGGDGSRRYLCVELTGVIDTETPIDYRRLYAQAMHELNEGQPYHFSRREEAEIQEHNRNYQQQTSAEEVLLSYFAPAPKKEEYFMKTVDILSELSKFLRSEDLPTVRKLAIALRRNGFRNDTKDNRRGWYVKRIS